MTKPTRENRNHQLDQAGRQLLRAARASDAEVDAALASPFLYARIRARLGEANRNPAQPFSPGALLALVFRRAIPLLMLVALLAVGAYQFIGKARSPQSLQPSLADQNILLPISEPKAPVTACSITSRSECVVSTDDVVALLVNAKERQK
ncbi:MAG: hypothetical protein HY231_04640 [Acidobacteria bacterium]|nr:hypothetical protein [Acidobacteriota bacterium]